MTHENQAMPKGSGPKAWPMGTERGGATVGARSALRTRQAEKRGLRRGVASIEALMGVIVLILLWAGTKTVAQAHVATLKAKAEARACAWIIAAGACKDIPASCEASTEEGHAPQGAEKLDAAGDRARGSDEKSESANRMVAAEVKGVFKKRITARSAYEVASSPILEDEGEGRGDSKELERSFSLPCNTNPVNLWDKKDEFNQKLTNDFNR